MSTPQTAMSTEQVVQAAYERFGAGDIPGMLEYLHSDVVVEFYGPSTIPYAGTWRGHDEVTRWLQAVYGSVDVNVFEPLEMISARDKVVTTGRLELVAKSTGREIHSDFVHVITVTDGKWSRFRDFMDTAVAVQAFA